MPPAIRLIPALGLAAAAILAWPGPTGQSADEPAPTVDLPEPVARQATPRPRPPGLESPDQELPAPRATPTPTPMVTPRPR